MCNICISIHDVCLCNHAHYYCYINKYALGFPITHSAVSKLSSKFDDDVEASATTSSSCGLTYLHAHNSQITGCLVTMKIKSGYYAHTCRHTHAQTDTQKHTHTHTHTHFYTLYICHFITYLSDVYNSGCKHL